MNKRVLPNVEDVVYAISEEPLGRGAEASVYKIHTNPDYTVRVSNDAPGLEALSKKIFEEGFIQQEDVFEGRNYAQPIAYLGQDADDKNIALVTINLYSPGFSMEIHKPGRPAPSSNEAMMKTLALSKAVADMPDSAIDRLYDDLHFLSSREFSIDTWNGGLFTNTGNILLSMATKEFRIIDLQPFIREHPGINRKHTKGHNTPYHLLHGLLPGAYEYAKEHATYLPLIDYRTEIVSKVIRGAQRNHLNDLGGYSGGDMNSVARKWEFVLSQLQIPEKYIESFVKDITSVTQENHYHLMNGLSPIVRVGRSWRS